MLRYLNQKLSSIWNTHIIYLSIDIIVPLC